MDNKPQPALGKLGLMFLSFLGVHGELDEWMRTGTSSARIQEDAGHEVPAIQADTIAQESRVQGCVFSLPPAVDHKMRI
jgi:hypothetical protein